MTQTSSLQFMSLLFTLLSAINICKVLVKNKRWQENGAPRVGELEHRTDSVDDGQERWAAEARESQ